MALINDYQARFSTQERVNLSNPQNSTATSVDSTRETNAAEDARGDFEAVCGVTYDSSNRIHVSASVPLVAQKLLVYTGRASQEDYDKFLDRLDKYYRLVLGRDRITPTTNSQLSPTAEEANSKPMDDLSNFSRFIGNAPGTSGVGDSPQATPTD